MQSFKSHYDAVVVGARVAGATTAMLLARSGLRVLAIDRQTYGSDRISTHAIMRGGVMLLKEWGILSQLLAEGTPKVQATSFIYDGEAVTFDIREEAGVDCLVAPRRTVLDRLLVDAAIRSGATVRHGVSLRELQFDRRGRVVGCSLMNENGDIEMVSTEMIIGADGRQSEVARQVGAPIYRQGEHCVGAVYGYFEGLDNRGYQWYFADRTAAGAIPTNHGQHCVFVAVPSYRFASVFQKRLDQGFTEVVAANSEALAESLRGARLAERLRGFAGCAGYFRQSFGSGWALVGDAGYFKDPLTAHGITDALRDAMLVSRAVVDGGMAGLAEYQARRDRMSSDLFEITDAVASFDWDMNEIRQLHHRLSRAMKEECQELAAFDRKPKLAA